MQSKSLQKSRKPLPERSAGLFLSKDCQTRDCIILFIVLFVNILLVDEWTFSIFKSVPSSTFPTETITEKISGKYYKERFHHCRPCHLKDLCNILPIPDHKFLDSLHHCPSVSKTTFSFSKSPSQKQYPSIPHSLAPSIFSGTSSTKKHSSGRNPNRANKCP